MKRNLFVQIAILVVLSSAIAVVANGFASRTRRLVLPGYYPNALRVPPKEPVRVPPPARTETAVEETPTTTVAPNTATTATASIAPVEETTTTAPPVPPERRAEARPTLTIDLAKFQPHPDRASVDISGEEAAALHKAGALFLDARRTSVYEADHIAGARSFSVWESDIDDKVTALFEERPDPADQNKPIVIYCSGGACEDSHMLAQKLWGIQFNNLYVYKDGFPDWQQRGGAVKTGSNP